MELKELVVEAYTLCGSGSEPTLIQLSERYQDPAVWQVALAAVRRANPQKSVIGYLQQALVTASRGHAQITARWAEPLPSESEALPLLERVARRRDERRHGARNQREWELQDLAQASAALELLFQECGEDVPPRRWTPEIRNQYRELSAWEILARQDVRFRERISRAQ